MTSRTYSIRLTANLRAQIDSRDPGLSFGYLTILLASIVMKIIAIFCENSPILRKFDLFWPPGPCDHKFDLIKTWSKYFCRTCHSLSNAVYRLSLSFLVFQFSGGGGHPPPAVRRWLRGRARVNLHLNVIILRNPWWIFMEKLWSNRVNFRVKWTFIRNPNKS